MTGDFMGAMGDAKDEQQAYLKRLSVGFVYCGEQNAFTSDASQNKILLDNLNALLPTLEIMLADVFKGYQFQKARHAATWSINWYSLRPVFGCHYFLTASSTELEAIKSSIVSEFKRIRDIGDENNLLGDIFVVFSPTVFAEYELISHTSA